MASSALTLARVSMFLLIVVLGEGHQQGGSGELHLASSDTGMAKQYGTESLAAQEVEQQRGPRPAEITTTKEVNDDGKAKDEATSATARFTKEVFAENCMWKYLAALVVGSLMALIPSGKDIDAGQEQKVAKKMADMADEEDDLEEEKTVVEEQQTTVVEPQRPMMPTMTAAPAPEVVSVAAPLLAEKIKELKEVDSPVMTPRTEAPGSDYASSNASTSPTSSAQSTPETSPVQAGSPATPLPGGLLPSPTAWRPRGAKKSAEEKVVGEIKSILNKLTREKYATLSEKLFELITERKHVECVANEVFEKATTQHHFIEMYADLCYELLQRTQASGIFAEKSGGSSFKRVLLDQCQASFERYLKRPSGLDKMEGGDEQYEALVKYKTSMLGNVRLVGALLRRKMLSPKIIFLCTDELLRLRTEETMETICAFLDAVCPVFDTPEWPEGSLKFCVIFDILNSFVTKSEFPISVRAKCLIQDLLDKKKTCWGKAAAPKDAPKQEEEPKAARSVSPKSTQEPKSADADDNWRARPSTAQVAPVPRVRDSMSRTNSSTQQSLNRRRA